PGRGESHEQGHRAWYAYSAGCQLSPPGGLGSDHPTLDLINKACWLEKIFYIRHWNIDLSEFVNFARLRLIND
ncbi:hypothetical protein N8Y19_00005, partial [Enterobacter hormaechei subsp. hoffmannii]|nr:hypothetical protein [Enterobacter hormaechei subsp. hoffmannii]